MAHDVFISYSRKDLSLIEPLVKDIEKRANVRCWIDWNGIESGSQFEDVIVKAIDSVKVVLFFLSENSMNSDYVKMEVNYAYNTRKKVVPIVLDGGSLRGWFLFKFGAVHFIDVNQERQYNRLINDLIDWCGTAAPTPIPQPKPAPTKTYKVGDYYDDGTKQGVVFEVTGDGKHGKIVSLTESCDWLQWSSDDNEQKRLIDAFNDYSGASNMVKVKLIEGWYEKYPAFAWCADLGKGWYLPTKEELRNIFRVKNQLNELLVSKGVPSLNGGYWSSTEINEKICGRFCAWFAYIGDDSTYNNYSADSDAKNRGYYVRAVATF